MTAASGMEDGAPDALERSRGGRWMVRVDRWGERVGQLLNPILIKEARQALKSRQFIVTFGLLLFAAWVWSVVGVLRLMPGLYYTPGGSSMLIGYYLVLAVPMLAVVPLAANRSLASEMDDATFELLAITALGPLQIVTGKLASAMLQMLVYFAALVPCLAFTYLLRGVDIPTILLVVGLTFFAALILTIAGLLLATLASGRAAQFALMIVLLGMIIVGEFVAGSAAISMIGMGAPVTERGFLEFVLALVTIAGSFCVLGVLAAAARLTPVSENRSTRLRVMMLVQQALWIGWMVYAAVRAEQTEFAVVSLLGLGGYWLVMGTLMLGEGVLLSPRVQRGLPQSFVARMFLSWFTPGPGTGVVFATLSCSAAAATVVVFVEAFRSSGASLDVVEMALLMTGYLMMFLGFARLVMLLLRRWIASGMLAAAAVQGVAMSAAAIIPYAATAHANDYRPFDYGVAQLTNWVWTLEEFFDRALPNDVPYLVFFAGLVSIHLNLLLLGGALLYRRLKTPARVLADDRQARDPADEDDGGEVDPFAPEPRG